MKLINQKVEHPAFGNGQIITVEDARMVIEFAAPVGQKAFVYPDAFEHYLRLDDPLASEYANTLLRRKHEEKEVEKLRQQELRREEEQKPPAASRGKGTRKTAAKKTN
ncbi:hypothetical protein [Gorillibacterium sp. CAU 1737]|uniref:hypothetical protein n=1 Tax=Gorillibacterium sp. CAU 1737 TaxID=3140362 RepID=UPI0032618E67